MNSLALNALIFMLAVSADRFLPEPSNSIHPVAWMGRAITVLLRISPKRPLPALLFGGGLAAGLVGTTSAATWLVMDGLSSLGEPAYVLGGALIMRTTFAVTGLSFAADRTRIALTTDRLDRARASLRDLVSRDAASLTPPLVAAAAIESVAENTTDSFVGPWLALAVFGVPAAVAYRAVNTLDSMIGYRGAYEYLGKTSARLDDIVNLVPARLCAALLLLAGASARLPVGRGWQIMVRDRGLTPSPNAGWTMSAMSGLLGVRLEKSGQYRLGKEFTFPGARDIGRAVEVAERTAALAFLTALAVAALRFVIAG